ncbi:MAG: hypothetical protein ACFCBU_03470, partial [Cyanophyceae cyanobacterium]
NNTKLVKQHRGCLIISKLQDLRVGRPWLRLVGRRRKIFQGKCKANATNIAGMDLGLGDGSHLSEQGGTGPIPGDHLDHKILTYGSICESFRWDFVDLTP